MKQKFLEKIESKGIRAGVVGLGYVGLPLAVEIAKVGYKTIGIDLDEKKVETINAGGNYIQDVPTEELAKLVREGSLSATGDFSKVGELDFIAICVPTPLDKHQQPDISHVKSSAKAISLHLKKETMVVLESTTYPGTTEELIKPILEEGSGLRCGVDFYLAFSPERVDPGNKKFNTKNTPKVLGAIGADATEVISKMYRSVLDGEIHTVSSPSVAEMEKILENVYRNINIGLINELAILCNRMNINIWEVIEAAKTKPFGFQAFYPGPGLGGHCIPLDPYYLSWKAKECDFHTSMIETSMNINERMPEYCVDRAGKVLNRYKKALNGSRILVLGVAYKQDIDDYRESPAIKLIDKLRAEGAEVVFYDPFVSEYRTHGGKVFSSEPELSVTLLHSVDLVIITTPHSSVDYKMVVENSVAIFDTRNALKGFAERGNIEVL